MKLTLLTGNNDYEIRRSLLSIKNKQVDSFGLDSLSTIYSSETELNGLKQAFANRSLFDLGNSRMLIIHDFSSVKSFVDYLSDKTGDMPDDLELVLVDSGLDKRSRLYKFCKNNNLIKQHDQLSQYQATGWLSDFSKEQHGITLKPEAAQLIIDKVGLNQWLLVGELQKLVLSDAEISKQLIDRVVENTPQEDIFALLDSLSSGKVKKALGIFDDLYAKGNEPIYIVSMLIWSFHNLLAVKSAEGQSDGEIAKNFAIAPFVVGKTKALTKGLSLLQLRKIINDLFNADFDLKNKNINNKLTTDNLIVGIGQDLKQPT